MRGELTSSKKMKLGWESVQVSRLWSTTEEAPSQPAVGTKLKVIGDNSVYLFIFCPRTFVFLAPYYQSPLPILLLSVSFPTVFHHV